MPAYPGGAARTTSGRLPRRYRLAPPAGSLDGQGGLVWWEPAQRCWVSARFLLDGRLVERRHERLAEVVHALEGDGVMTDQVLEALLADRERNSWDTVCQPRTAVRQAAALVR